MKISITFHDIESADTVSALLTAGGLIPTYIGHPPRHVEASQPTQAGVAEYVKVADDNGFANAPPVARKPPEPKAPTPVPTPPAILAPFVAREEVTVAIKRESLINGVKLGELKIGQMRAAADAKGYSLSGLSRYQIEKALFSLYYGDGSEAAEIRKSHDEAAASAPPAPPARGRGRPPKNATPPAPPVEDVPPVPAPSAPAKAEPETEIESEVEDATEIFDEPEDAENTFDEADGEDFGFDEPEPEPESSYVVTKVPETLKEASRFADIVKSIAAIHKTRDANEIYRWMEAYAPHVPRLQAGLASVNEARIRGVLAT